jgi:hypothetical protein
MPIKPVGNLLGQLTIYDNTNAAKTIAKQAAYKKYIRRQPTDYASYWPFSGSSG